MLYLFGYTPQKGIQAVVIKPAQYAQKWDTACTEGYKFIQKAFVKGLQVVFTM
jgi:hypothetical protein